MKKIDQYYEKKSSEPSKRNLSDGSANSGNSPKRTIYDADDGPVDFPEQMPQWVSVLIDTIDKVGNRVDDVMNRIDNLTASFDSFKTQVNNQISDINSNIATLKVDYDQKIGDLATSSTFISAEYEEQKKLITDLQERMKAAEKNLETTKSKCKSYEGSLDSHSAAIESAEQYSRRNCALLHGVPEADGEKTDALVIDTIKQHLGVELQPHDFDRSHRLGPPRIPSAKIPHPRPRPIIIKFNRYNTRADVFQHKKKFKGSQYMITESLTRPRAAAFQEARLKYGDKKVWTMDGEIFIKNDKDKTVNLRLLMPLH